MKIQIFHTFQIRDFYETEYSFKSHHCQLRNTISALFRQSVCLSYHSLPNRDITTIAVFPLVSFELVQNKRLPFERSDK